MYPRPPQKLFHVQFYVPSSSSHHLTKTCLKHNFLSISFLFNNPLQYKLLYIQDNVYMDFDANWDEKDTRDTKNHILKVYIKNDIFDTKFLWNIVTRRQCNDWYIYTRYNTTRFTAQIGLFFSGLCLTLVEKIEEFHYKK